MFKVISMHSKPLKHAKYNEILTITSKKHDFSKFLTDVDFWSKYICSESHNLHARFSRDLHPSMHNKTPLKIIQKKVFDDLHVFIINL